MKSKALKRIFELQAKTEADAAAVKADISAANDSIQSAREILKTTDSPEAYAEAKETIRKNEEVVMILNRKLPKVEKPLSDADYLQIRDDIKTEREKINADYSKKINDHLTEILKLYADYEAITKDYSYGIFELENLAGREHTNKIKPVDIAASIKDPDGWFGALCLWYFQKREKLALVHHVQKTGIVPPTWK